MTDRDWHQVWVEQCAAAETIKLRNGLKAAFDYAVAEKLLNFAEAAAQHPEFARELPRNFAAPWTGSASGRSRSSNAPTPPGASKSSLDDGSSNAPLHGSGAADGWQKTGRNPSPPARHGSISPISDSQPAASQGLGRLLKEFRVRPLEVLQADAILSHSACKSTRRDTAISTKSSPRWPAMAR